MINENSKIELLAPAKNKECAFAAINAGADAVYIGAQAFGARKKAGNSLEDLAQIVDYAHKFLVKVYVTVNTILYDSELKDAEKLIWDLYDIGVDAIIFQDFSFFEMNLPPIALHASTQCNNDSLEKIKFLKQMNVERAVLPREFSLDEIRQVTQNVDIETEVFVHGALCVCYSGQCYFSSYIGGRSANRGECAQPCRKKYSLEDENGKVILKPQYLLSMKDNNLSSHLKDLVDAGVTSLKIEGRLKDAQYVTNVVSYYRKEIDKISANLMPSLGEVMTDFVPDVNKTFNRGYTDFFIDGKRKQYINPASPKFIGEKAGRVVRVYDNAVQLDSKLKLNVSDKITYFDSGGNLSGTTVTKLSQNKVFLLNTGTLKSGTVVYRNVDSEFYKKLNTSYFKRKIPVAISVSNTEIVMKSFGNNIVFYKLEENFEKANNPVMARENVIKQLSKLGDSEFFAQNVSVASDFSLFIPVAKLNEIRRKMVFDLQTLSKKNYVFQRRDTNIQFIDYPENALDYSYNVSNSKAKSFYEKCGARVLEPAFECAKPESKITLMKTKHCLRDFAGMCLKKGGKANQLYLVDEYGSKFPLKFDCKKCIMKIEEP